MRVLKNSLFFIVALVLANSVFAVQQPVSMLQDTSQEMIEQLKKNSARVKKDPSYVYGLAKQILLPHVDMMAMSRLALGREHWTAATSAQQKKFIDSFSNMMIRTYATALASYTDEEIKFKPLRVDAAKAKRVQVDSLIIQHGGPSIPVSYRLYMKGGEWKVYDITVDGVSMVQSFRSQFSNQIARGGMDGLLTAMKQHTAKVN